MGRWVTLSEVLFALKNGYWNSCDVIRYDRQTCTYVRLCVIRILILGYNVKVFNLGLCGIKETDCGELGSNVVTCSINRHMLKRQGNIIR